MAMAGRFHPGDARTLARDVDPVLGAAVPAGSARAPKMLVVPHAGYIYSGPVAAQAYALLAPWCGHIRQVVLLGPTHCVAVRGLALPDVCAFVTPLGQIELDPDVLSQLRGLSQVSEPGAGTVIEGRVPVAAPRQ